MRRRLWFLACIVSVTLTTSASTGASLEGCGPGSTSSATACMSSPFSPRFGFPATFYNGPLGRGNILPPKTAGALFGLWPYLGGTRAEMQNAVHSREAVLGRKLDIVHIHWAAPSGACDYGRRHSPFTRGVERWIVNHGSVLVMSWTHGWTIDEVNAGAADACLVHFGRKAAAFGRRFLLRIYHEFNGGWSRWTGIGRPFIDAWRRTVQKIREGGGTNVGFIWSPANAEPLKAFQSYPGGAWVDWVGVSAYNWNRPLAWCSPCNRGPWCELRDVLSSNPALYPTIYDRYSQSKPFIVAENGSVEDPSMPGRKGQWFRNARDMIPTGLPLIRAVTYFDLDLTPTENVNWRLDTSQSSLAGFRDLALDPFFNTRACVRGKCSAVSES
jgi:hypothetical protein